MALARQKRWLAAVLALCGACAPAYQQKGKSLDEFTLQNLMQWPAGIEYIEGKGSGRPPDGEKNVELRRKASREEAVLEAERQLIPQLEQLVPRGKVRDTLRKAQLGSLEYTYDDGCRLTLRIPKDAVVGQRPIE